ncbi:MAG: AAA family ATPase, partial [Sedimenticola sp.]|nr:AAA family ATPase [Sedimenticola sp.]
MQESAFPSQFPDESGASDKLRIPPHSIQAEQSVIGGLMLDNQSWDQVADRVSEIDFYRREHQLIFRAIEVLADQSRPFDVITLSEEIQRHGDLEKVGGLAYLGNLAKDTPSAANIRAYADIVRERSVMRQLIHVGNEIADSGFRPEGRDSSELLDAAETKVFEIAEKGAKGKGGFEGIKSLLTRAVDKIETLFAQDEPITGLSTGFADLDKMTSGLQPADLVIVAGRPSMGKTTFAMNMAENVALLSKKPVAVFSMEMPGEALAMRMMSSLGRINQTRVRTGKLEDDEWPRLTSAVSMLAETRFFIDDTPALTPLEVRARARRLMREHGELGMIMLDYLQLMQVPGMGDNRTN